MGYRPANCPGQTRTQPGKKRNPRRPQALGPRAATAIPAATRTMLTSSIQDSSSPTSSALSATPATGVVKANTPS